jgi:type II secretory pathway pseudopilin PulG
MPTGKLLRFTPQQGFTLLGLLFLIAVLGVALAVLGTLWHSVNLREKEAELLFIGDQYRRALLSYYQHTPGDEKNYPRQLTDLLLDPRFPQPVRHLRRLYSDPISRAAWQVLRNEAGEIIGIHSASTAMPRKIAGFPPQYTDFAGVNRYADWVFRVE